MKKRTSIGITFLAILMFIITFNFAGAQSQSNLKTLAAISLQSPQPPSVQFRISIPDEYSSRIVRENIDNGSYFRFKRTDGNLEFLFQVTKIPEGQWLSIKGQLSNATILDHKNGFIYFAQVTDKGRIKGADNADYEQVYGRLHQLISTIIITEGEMN